MSDLDSNEHWQVEVNEQVYEASFAELTQWIAEGSLLPGDKVRRGYLRWIEAAKVPSLASQFNARTAGTSVVIANTVTPSDDATSPISIEINPKHLSVSERPSAGSAVELSNATPGSNVCAGHPDRDGAFICMSCGRTECRECVKSFGSSVAICSVCGGMARSRAEVETELAKQAARADAIEQGFGLKDFVESISYPFRFKTSLIFGSAMFAFFSVGQGAAWMGGIYMIVAALFSYMLANMLAFGILANTVESFAHGKVGKNFMPDFDDFDLWDDVVHPFFLSVGVWISSFGPFAITFLVGAYLVMSSVSSQMDTVKSNLEQTPGTPYYNVRDTLDQSNQVKSVLEQSSRINQQHLDQQASLENGQQPVSIDQSEESFDHVNKMVADGQRKELESVVGKSPETQERESAAFTAALLNLAAPITVIGFITFLWGVVYFPAACVVAGYTRSFAATINPMVGLDTARRLGADYAKVLLMSGTLVIVFLVINYLLATIFSEFNLPGVGNLPARALSSLVYFYLVIVFSCVVGLAVYKRSERLAIAN
jgi:hypothetical protein